VPDHSSEVPKYLEGPATYHLDIDFLVSSVYFQSNPLALNSSTFTVRSGGPKLNLKILKLTIQQLSCTMDHTTYNLTGIKLYPPNTQASGHCSDPEKLPCKKYNAGGSVSPQFVCPFTSQFGLCVMHIVNYCDLNR
jgi:hypothetical protein